VLPKAKIKMCKEKRGGRLRKGEPACACGFTIKTGENRGIKLARCEFLRRTFRDFSCAAPPNVVLYKVRNCKIMQLQGASRTGCGKALKNAAGGENHDDDP
jgi:hypothetical protein